jgi:hypothetical protein
VTVSVPFRTPEVPGLNTTLMLQVPSAAIVEQLCVSSKSPLTWIPAMLINAPLGLERITVCAELEAPIGTLPKDTVEEAEVIDAMPTVTLMLPLAVL